MAEDPRHIVESCMNALFKVYVCTMETYSANVVSQLHILCGVRLWQSGVWQREVEARVQQGSVVRGCLKD